MKNADLTVEGRVSRDVCVRVTPRAFFSHIFFAVAKKIRLKNARSYPLPVRGRSYAAQACGGLDTAEIIVSLRGQLPLSLRIQHDTA